jgi:magnesium transporter
MSASPDRVEWMVDLVRNGEIPVFVRRAHDFDPADLADVLAALDEDERIAVVQALPPELSSQALAELPEDAHAEQTLAALSPERAAEIVEELEDDDAVGMLRDLEPAAQQAILQEVEDRAEVERLLKYDEETAGGRMTTHLVSVRATSTAAEALEEIRRQSEEVEDFYQVFVVDGDRRLVGILPFKSLVVSRPDRQVAEVMEPADVFVAPDLDQEEVARLMARYNLPSVAVVDEDSRLLGRVTFDDVIDVVEAETTEDLLKFGGVSPDEELAAEWTDSVRSRLPWLGVNLITASLAASVVYFYQAEVERAVVLAVFMPIVAGMGGNAGTQALAVTVRRLALGLIPQQRFMRVVGKEMLVGLTNGFAIGAVVGLTAALVGSAPVLGLVVFLAMTVNLLIAGFAGAFIPITLERLGVDPAIASSIFVTTFTDTFGFLLLLGLAGWLLL